MHLHSFKNLHEGEKLTETELIRAIRHSISDEFDAIALYEIIAESTDNEEVKKLMEEVADDEKEHVGNFLRLLQILAPDEEDLYEEGEKETDDILGRD